MKKNIIFFLLFISVFFCYATDNGISVVETVFVQGGTYNWKKLLGIGSEEVTVSDLYVQKYETTRSEWEAFINETGKQEFYKITAVQLNYYNLMAYPESAAVGMTFYEALEYCNWRSKKEGYMPVYTLRGDMPVQSSYPKPVKMPEIVVNKKADGYRLPEETEWIYFALGGSEGIKTKWWEKRPVERYAWVATTSSSTEPVGKLEPNPVGLYDVFGNAWEWCWDVKPNSAGEEGVNKSRLSCGACVSYTKSQNVGKDVLPFMAALAKKGGSDPLERYYTGVRMVRNAAGVGESAQGLFGSRYSAGKSVYAADNLNIRAAPNVRGEKVVTIAKGSPLTVLEEGKKETIDGITAPWVKVRLPDGKEGWCFAGYVAAKKIYKAVLDREEPIIKNPENGTKNLESIDHLIIDSKVVRLGSTKPKGIISNIILEAPFMEFYKFGDIEGYENRDTIIGWNNMNAVIFITTVDSAARTQSGITIGSTREEVIRVYGEEYLSTKNRIQYINSDFELVGMIFYFENNRVIRITCFTHI